MWNANAISIQWFPWCFQCDQGKDWLSKVSDRKSCDTLKAKNQGWCLHDRSHTSVQHDTALTETVRIKLVGSLVISTSGTKSRYRHGHCGWMMARSRETVGFSSMSCLENFRAGTTDPGYRKYTVGDNLLIRYENITLSMPHTKPASSHSLLARSWCHSPLPSHPNANVIP